MKKHGNLFWFPSFKGCNTNKTKELNMKFVNQTEVETSITLLNTKKIWRMIASSEL